MLLDPDPPRMSPKLATSAGTIISLRNWAALTINRASSAPVKIPGWRVTPHPRVEYEDD
jgi:hypothetical protein